MAIKVIMPHMGESVAEGRVLQWFKREGEPVKRDEVIAEVETDKANVEIPAPEDGVLAKILAKEGDVIAVGAEMALLERETAAVSASKELPRPAPAAQAPQAAPAPTSVERPRQAPAPAAPRPAGPAHPATQETQETLPGERQTRDQRFTITPVVAKVMERHGLSLEDLRGISGTGDGGRVTKQDILAFLERRSAAVVPPAAAGPAPSRVAPPAPSPAPAPEVPAVAGEDREAAGAEDLVEEVPLTGLRKAIAEHMVRSKRTAPHVTTVAEVDVTTLVEFRERHKDRFQEAEGLSLTYMPFFIKAVCAGLKAFPALNASLEGEKVLLRRSYHIGVAVETGAGLVVPVIRHADRLSIRELAKALHRVAEGARARKLSPADLEGGTFTITNPGVFGGVLSTPIIHQPQAAILGVQAIRKQPVVRDDQIVIRSMVYLCLSYDHRIVDGATSVQFLQAVRRHLEDPLAMFV